MFCLTDCGDDAHDHVQSCKYKTDSNAKWGSPEESRTVLCEKIKNNFAVYWDNLKVDPETKNMAMKDEEIRQWMGIYSSTANS